MAEAGGRTGSYDIHARTEELMIKPKPRDLLRFDVVVTLRHSNSFWHGDVIRMSTLLETSIPISYESFFDNNQDFLRSFLFDPRCSCYFDPESLDQISQEIIPLVQELLEFPSDPEFADLECQEIPLTLDIILDVPEDEESEEDEEREEDEEIERAILEESMQQCVSMIPASKEAIQSLKPFIDSHLNMEECTICMENFHEEENENVKLSSMPCDHVFHHLCIVKWLQTSHMCPLCRYTMPTFKD